MFDLTDQEKKVVIFLIAAALAGSGVVFYKNVRSRPRVEVVAGALDANAGQQGRSAGVVNINTATLDELISLEGIGPVLAKAIIEYRDASGPFTDTSDLKKVKGIGDAKYKAIGERVTVE